jgi:hypothetical protein
MTVDSPPVQDPILGAGPLVVYKDEFVVTAGANATIYFALRYCSAGGIPNPMRFEATVAPQSFVNGVPAKPFAAVCSISTLKAVLSNSNVKSVVCESDVGKFRSGSTSCL